MSQVLTFYSYKGGVGRTMALANITVLLSQWGYKTLIIDWDLEAPGLEFFFKDFLDTNKVAKKKGIIDILTSDETAKKTWQEYLTPISIPQSKEPIHLLSAGHRGKNYLARVRNFDVDRFYEKTDGGAKIESLREEWKEAYDFILIDSRTGITDNGGICTIHLPDILVLLFTATDQGFNGIIEIADRASQAQQNLPFDRQKLISLPIPSKFDTHTEFKISQEWLDKFAKGLKKIYRDWLPITLPPRQFLEITKIPYVTYFSFGETLPVVEQGVNDPTSLGYAYETIAALLANNFDKIEYMLENRDEFINLAIRNKPPKETRENGQRKIKFYISYSHIDSIIKKRLDQYLSLLERQKNAEFWSYEDILPGMAWKNVIEEKRENAQVFLILVSPGYLESENTREEFNHIYSRYGYVRLIIPIILHPSNWMKISSLSHFQALPRNRLPISEWEDQDKAFGEIIDELEKVIDHILGTPNH